MSAEPIEITTADGPMPAYEASPDTAAARGGVVVIQEAFGVNDHIEDVTRRLAAAGWHALAPHLFHRDGSPVLAYDDLEGAMRHTRALTGDGLRTDVGACLEHLKGLGFGPERAAVVGFCMGGSAVFFAATQWPLGAAVTFYGGGVAEPRWRGVPSLLDLAPQLQTPWLGLYGDLDHSIPVDQIQRLEKAVAQAPVPAEVVRYPEAGHGFHCDQRPANYEPQAAGDAWQRMLRWFERHIPASG